MSNDPPIPAVPRETAENFGQLLTQKQDACTHGNRDKIGACLDCTYDLGVTLYADLAALRVQLAQVEQDLSEGRRIFRAVQEQRDGLEREIEATEAEVARLTQEKDELASTLNSPDKWMRWCDSRVLERCERAEAELETRQQAIKKLHSALERYATHARDCPLTQMLATDENHIYSWPADTCTCGLAKVLK